MQVTIFLAFGAGLASFLSPCVLPLVPGYISMLSGMGVEQLKEGKHGGVMGSSLAFVSGFSVVFIAFGASASAVGQFLVRNRSLLAPIAGALIILFALHLIGWLSRISITVGLAIGGALLLVAVLLWQRPDFLGFALRPAHFASLSLIFMLGPTLTRWLNRDLHFRNLGGQPGAVSGFLMGFAFAFGWTPCIGPILGAVLIMAANSESVGRGVFLLAMYSAGLAIPFLLTALGISLFLRFYQRFRGYMHAVEVSSGVLLLFIGGLIFFNRLTWLSGKLTFLNYFAR
jgi:cytochrome c-type biogenesis protein